MAYPWAGQDAGRRILTDLPPCDVTIVDRIHASIYVTSQLFFAIVVCRVVSRSE